MFSISKKFGWMTGLPVSYASAHCLVREDKKWGGDIYTSTDW